MLVLSSPLSSSSSSSSSSNSSRSIRYLFTLILLSQSFSSVVSSACYFDSVTGQTVCEGLPYGARLAIAAAITIVGVLMLAGFSFWIRKKYYSSQGPPAVSVGYYGPPQTNYPPASAYPQPNSYPAPAIPAYDPTFQQPPGYNYNYQPTNQPPPKSDQPQHPPPPGQPSA